MTRKSPFAIQKAVQGIGGDRKSIKKLRSGDLLIEAVSALQTKSFLLAKSFLDCPLTASPHKSLNSSRGIISEPDLLCTPDAEILEGFSDQGVVQKPRKSTPEQDSENEDMIEYNPDEFDPDEYVQKYYDIGEYTSVITPTCYKNVKN
ncbi:RNA-directed DNA polymerase from mobile element jockey [Trichonephila clavipes]|nr:RNA-directed DNA polymerase from mobile element jockey [Trichonephila clavipes]